MEVPDVAPLSTYLVAKAFGKPLYRIAGPGRRRPGPVFLRRPLGPRFRLLPRRPVPDLEPRSATRCPAQTPARVLPGSPRQVRRPPGTKTPRLRRRLLFCPAVALG